MEKNACKRIKDKMERLTQEVDVGYRAERETPTRVHTHTHTHTHLESTPVSFPTPSSPPFPA